ncbi:MAG: hypothetical protein V9H69_16045 [Anaerolineae bacterium]
MLANGNIVVADPDYRTPTAGSVGAVYLYDGDTLALISVLTGSQANDRVGGYACGQTCAAPTTVLSNGLFLVNSSDWHGGRGALTWMNGATGLSGIVSAQNSLVGRAFSTDLVDGIVLALPNDNYVALSPLWGGGEVASDRRSHVREWRHRHDRGSHVRQQPGAQQGAGHDEVCAGALTISTNSRSQPPRS